jgi:hypothetical protein
MLSINDDFARKLEQLLGSFGRLTQFEETNSLVTVPITQWFSKTWNSIHISTYTQKYDFD